MKSTKSNHMKLRQHTHMIKYINFQLIAVLVGGILFSYLFWMEKQALNLLIYTTFVSVIIFIDPEKQKNKKLYLAAAAHFSAALLVVVNHSVLNMITWYISLGVMVGFAHFHALKSIFASLFAAFIQMIMAPLSFIKRVLGTKFSTLSVKPALKLFKYLIIPFIVIILFSILYSIANNVFANYAQQFLNSIAITVNNIFTFFFADLSMLRLLHLILGIGITSGILITVKDLSLEKIDTNYTEQLIRKRNDKKSNTLIYDLTNIFAANLLKRNMALKTENVIGIISFSALNLLLFFLNAIDISTLWLRSVPELNGNGYSAELHDGTNALIFSIVMAMMVIVYFFSGNLNFYRKNKAIRLLAYLWIIQNIFLVCSVLLRDFNYINAHGLTYKRIGVLVFLLLCMIGIVTVYLKVAKQKTFFYLCKVNGLAWYILLLAFGFINWDVFIVSYNLNNRDNISLDLDHLISLSDKTLPLLNENKHILKRHLITSRYAHSSQLDTATNLYVSIEIPPAIQIQSFEADLKKRINRFQQAQSNSSWLSWNFRDWQTHQYLGKNHLLN